MPTPQEELRDLHEKEQFRKLVERLSPDDVRFMVYLFLAQNEMKHCEIPLKNFFPMTDKRIKDCLKILGAGQEVGRAEKMQSGEHAEQGNQYPGFDGLLTSGLMASRKNLADPSFFSEGLEPLEEIKIEEIKKIHL
jgi:hypothetical protein